MPVGLRDIREGDPIERICVTATGADLDAPVDPYFGRCRYFLIVDPSTMMFEAIDNPAASAPGGAGIQAAQAIASKGVDVLLTGEVGPNASGVLAQAGIEVVTGVGGRVRDAVIGRRDGTLSRTPVAGGSGFPGGYGRRMGRRGPRRGY